MTGVHIARRHRCATRTSVHCTRGNGRATRQRCAWCGSRIHTEAGVWTVLPWRGDGRYRMEDAVSTHRSERAAERSIRPEDADTLCVRFLAVTA